VNFLVFRGYLLHSRGLWPARLDVIRNLAVR
jgi:hypothetical protein